MSYPAQYKIIRGPKWSGWKPTVRAFGLDTISGFWSVTFSVPTGIRSLTQDVYALADSSLEYKSQLKLLALKHLQERVEAYVNRETNG